MGARAFERGGRTHFAMLGHEGVAEALRDLALKPTPDDIHVTVAR